MGDGLRYEDIPSMLAGDDEAWEELSSILEANPGTSLHDPASPVRTSRDVYAHLAHRMEISTNAVKILLTGGKPPEPDGEEMDARFQREAAGLSLEEARQWALMARQERKRVIAGIPSYAWNSETEKYARCDGAAHYREHISNITLTGRRPVTGPEHPVPARKEGVKAMYEVMLENHFEAAHYLRGYEGKCESLHGHGYRIVVRIRVTQLNEIGLSWDFTDIKAKLGLVLERYDHTCLNDIKPFDSINPSAENIASTIYGEFNEKLAAGQAKLVSVEVWETPYQGVAYIPE